MGYIESQLDDLWTPSWRVARATKEVLRYTCVRPWAWTVDVGLILAAPCVFEVVTATTGGVKIALHFIDDRLKDLSHQRRVSDSETSRVKCFLSFSEETLRKHPWLRTPCASPLINQSVDHPFAEKRITEERAARQMRQAKRKTEADQELLAHSLSVKRRVSPKYKRDLLRQAQELTTDLEKGKEEIQRHLELSGTAATPRIMTVRSWRSGLSSDPLDIDEPLTPPKTVKHKP